jgi:hypothetical protein
VQGTERDTAQHTRAASVQGQAQARGDEAGKGCSPVLEPAWWLLGGSATGPLCRRWAYRRRNERAAE